MNVRHFLGSEYLAKEDVAVCSRTHLVSTEDITRKRWADNSDQLTVTVDECVIFFLDCHPVIDASDVSGLNSSKLVCHDCLLCFSQRQGDYLKTGSGCQEVFFVFLFFLLGQMLCGRDGCCREVGTILAR